MKDDKLSEILQRKGFKNFWYCFEYLLIAGYPENEAIEYSFNVFNENTIFNDVAFMSTYRVKKTILFSLDEIEKLSTPSVIFKIGLFDETNRDLEPMVGVYRKWLAVSDKNKWQKQLEEPFTKVTFENLSEKGQKILLNLARKHYGFAPFDIITPPNTNSSIARIKYKSSLLDVEELNRQMVELVGIPANMLSQNTNTRII